MSRDNNAGLGAARSPVPPADDRVPATIATALDELRQAVLWGDDASVLESHIDAVESAVTDYVDGLDEDAS